MYAILRGMIQILVGIGALGGGSMLILDPSGQSLGLPLEYLSGSVFGTYLIPGLVLAGIIGVGHIVGAGLSFKRSKASGPACLALGIILIVWMAVQVGVIGYRMWIQALFLGVGGLEIALGYPDRASTKGGNR